MDNLVQTVITQIPNLGVAVWMLWQQQQTIKSLLDNQQKLIYRLLVYVDNDKRSMTVVQTAPSRILEN